jgi:hypothetical protein
MNYITDLIMYCILSIYMLIDRFIGGME